MQNTAILLPSEPAMGYLCTTQALESCTAMGIMILQTTERGCGA